ncbi:MAG: M1 family aminopeptidase [Saprospiraceae bacterium]
MFTTILKYEIRHWLKEPMTYIFFFTLLFLSAVSMGGIAEAFDEHSDVGSSTMLANTPWRLIDVVRIFTNLILLLVPIIFGGSVFRDYKNNVHTILYSFPFEKKDYLLAKYFSAALVMGLIVSSILIGVFLGTKIPTINQELLVPFNLVAYLQTYFVYLLPNVLLVGAIVFSIVTYTRNIYSGFVIVLLLMAMQAILNAVLGGMDNRFWGATLDPFGQNASYYYIRNWTKIDLNTQLVPFKGVVIYNRILWMGIATLLFGVMYRYFSFSQTAFSFSLKKSKGERFVKNNFGSIIKVNLPKVNFDFSFFQQLKTTWSLSNIDLKYIVRNWMFITLLFVGFAFVLLKGLQIDPAFGYKMLPLTWVMLQLPAFLFSGAILILTFLFAGMLVHRDRMVEMNQLVDISPLPNWVFLFSKFLALVKMQIFLLIFILIGGVVAQTILDYHQYEFGNYLFRLYIVMLPSFMAWAMASLFVQTVFTNAYLGIFILLLSSAGTSLVPEQLGMEHDIFKFNNAPNFTYSDMDGYGGTLGIHMLFRFYWNLFGGVLLCGALLFWVRGIPYSFKERLGTVVSRFKGRFALAMMVLLIGFLSLGFGIYYQDKLSGGDPLADFNLEKVSVENELKFGKYKNLPQPEIEAINIHLDIFPATKDFRAKGKYTYLNKTTEPIDTLLVHYSYDELTKFDFGNASDLILEDTVLRYGLHRLKKTLAVGDSVIMNFEVWNRPQTFFHHHSDILANGTYLKNAIFPRIGYRNAELENAEKRKKYGLPEKDSSIPFPSDSTALKNENIHWVHRFEATVSTSKDQIAIAPGYLQKEWIENDRRFFHYKMASKIKNSYAFNSARYEVKEDEWAGKSLQIFYHKNHSYNIDRMMKGLKNAFAYCSQNFGTYQHEQARIIEFPLTYGEFNTVFANSVPFSEATFLVDVDDNNVEVIDFPYKVAAHEVAHQWWGHQFIHADVKGKSMLTESMAEYVAAQVLEEEYGVETKRQYRKYSMESYFNGRRRESKEELPLIHALSNQRYLNYRKGEVVMSAMSEYLGEKRFNQSLKKYIAHVKFRDAATTTSIELLDFIKSETPDSLQYLIHDMFETITLYNNKITKVKTIELEDGKYQVDIEFFTSKYRTDGKGVKKYSDEKGDSIFYKEEKSLPLADYIEVGIFDEVGNELFLEKKKFSKMSNTFSFFLDKKPFEVGIDPYVILIDAELSNNRKVIEDGSK